MPIGKTARGGTSPAGYKWGWASAILASVVLLTGCGISEASTPPAHHTHTTAPAHHSHHHQHHSGGSGSSSGTGNGTQTGNSTTNGTGSGTSNGTGYGNNTTNNSNSTGSGGTPVPPPAGAYSDLTVQVVAMTQVGTANTSGANLPVWLVRLSITNPTTAMVPLELNDFSVVPVGSAGVYSWNDSDAAALTATNSLFWPIDTTDPGAHPAFIASGATVTGDVTVEVKSAARYDWVWGNPASGTIATTFQPVS